MRTTVGGAAGGYRRTVRVRDLRARSSNVNGAQTDGVRGARVKLIRKRKIVIGSRSRSSSRNSNRNRSGCRRGGGGGG